MPARAFAISQLLPPDLPDMGEDLLLRPPPPPASGRGQDDVSSQTKCPQGTCIDQLKSINPCQIHWSQYIDIRPDVVLVWQIHVCFGKYLSAW